MADERYTTALETCHLSAGTMDVRVLNLGGITQSWTRAGTPLILRYDTPEAYRTDPFYMGAIIGRVAGRVSPGPTRIGDATYTLVPNEGDVHLHGGPAGLSRQIWQMQQDGPTCVHLHHSSPDGAQGYPGRVAFTVTITLTENSLRYDMRATPDRPTWINLTQHNYYTLGGRDISDMALKLPTRAWMPSQPNQVASGTKEPVPPALDFTQTRRFGAAEAIDDAFHLDTGDIVLDGPAATLRLSSNQSYAQLYTGGGLKAPFAPFAAVCVEPQAHPNLPVLTGPDAPYRHTLTLEIQDAPR